MNEHDLKHLRAAIQIAQRARDHGNHPFGSLLVDENGSSTEPCPMCAGAIFWSGIGRVVYALSEQGLYSLTANSSDKLLLSCREVLRHGARPTEVIGPAIENEA